MHEIYTCDCSRCGGQIDRIALSETENKNLQKAFNKVARWVYSEKKQTITVDDLENKQIKPLIDGINSVLKEAVTSSIEYNIPESMTNHLLTNVYVFSGAKTYAELRELSDLLRDEKNEIKSFSKFFKDAREIHNNYNKNYLESEYLFATQSAQMASKWADFEKDGDEFNLQYRTANDDRVRDSHQLLHDMTLPPSDPFWSKFFPPNGWRCRCNVVQVRKNRYPVTDSATANEHGEKATYTIGAGGKNTSAMFRFNPGKEKVIFPQTHPYFPQSCATCTRFTQLSAKAGNDFCKFCTQIQDRATRKSVVETRKEARDWAKENIPSDKPITLTVGKEEFSEITVYRSTIKSFTGKAHKFEKERNLWATDFVGLFKKSSYYGWDSDEIIDGKQKHPDVKRWFYYKVEIGGENSFICVKEMKNGEFRPYCLDDQIAFDRHKHRIKREKPKK